MIHETAPARLLVVDDERAQVEALCDTLRDQGYDVVGHSDVEAGLHALLEQPFDLLLTDLMMPGIDGIDLMRKALEIDPSLVTIVMTGAGTIDNAVEAMRSGALDYIRKPFKLSAVLRVLARALSVRRLRVENERLSRELTERAAELEATNRDLDAFTRSASHDLRTPLNAVLGFASLLVARHAAQLPEEAQSWLAQIEREGQRMSALIEDLLGLAHLGKQPLLLLPVNLDALVRCVADELNQLDGRCQAVVHFEALPWAMGDEGLLRQVFINLLSNALKFTKHVANPRITVGFSVEDGEQVVFVRDNGAGFDMTQASRLFTAFERLHRSQDFEGTGIGLSIVQRIIERHGGRIWATSVVNQGATFYMTLPWI